MSSKYKHLTKEKIEKFLLDIIYKQDKEPKKIQAWLITKNGLVDMNDLSLYELEQLKKEHDQK